MPWTNYHSHNKYCDGTQTPEDFIIEAINKNMPAFGFSSHAPVDFNTNCCISYNELKFYLEDISRIKKKYSSQIQTYIGLEIDYIPNIAGRSAFLIKDIDLDFFIGSVHFVDCFSDGTRWNIDDTREIFTKWLKEAFNNNIIKACERFYEQTQQMILEDMPDVIGHLDKIKMYNNGNTLFNETDTFYRNQVNKTLEVIKKSGTIVEINTRGYYKYAQQDLYPSQWILEKLAKMDIPVMLNSDSHKPEEITAGFEYAVKQLKAAGIKYLWALIDNKWQAYRYNEEGIIL